MGVKIAQRKAQEMIERVGTELPDYSLFHFDHQEVKQERGKRAHKQDGRQFDQRYAQRVEIRIGLFRKRQDITVYQSAGKQGHGQRTERRDHYQQRDAQQSPFPVPEHMFEQAFHCWSKSASPPDVCISYISL